MASALTQKEFDKRMKKIHPDIKVLTGYKNSQTKVNCKCLIDEYEWATTPNKLLHAKHGCPKCGKSLPLTNKEFVSQMEKINPFIEIIGEYINSNTPIKCRCKIDGNEWMARPYHLKKGEKCPICARRENAKKLSKDIITFKKEMKELNDTIEILSDEYINEREKVECLCKKCGRTWKATPTNLLRDRGCPSCKSSKGERKIEQWLKENNLVFFREYKFEDCKDKRRLPFDFFLPEYNLALEYDGRQHYEPVTFGGISEKRAIKLFEENKKRDKIKEEYCANNGINFLRISYKNFDNIFQILEQQLKGRF